MGIRIIELSLLQISADYLCVCVCVCRVCVIRSANAPNKRVYQPWPREIGILPERAGILWLSERGETNRVESRRNRSTRAKHWKQLSNPRNRTVATVCAIWPGPRGGERQIVLKVRIGKAGRWHIWEAFGAPGNDLHQSGIMIRDRMSK